MLKAPRWHLPDHPRTEATAMVVDMRIVPPGQSSKQDGIAVRLDHRDGISVIEVFPYSFSEEGKLVMEPAFLVPGQNRVYPR